MATVIRAPPKDVRVIRKEWAAIRIQTAFRGLLARHPLRALKAVLQAIFQGRQVQKQAAVTLRCMQALVRVQARVRAKSAGVSSEKQAIQSLLDEYCSQVDPSKRADVRYSRTILNRKDGVIFLELRKTFDQSYN